MESMLPFGILLLVVGITITGIIILLVAVVEIIRDERNWLSSSTNRAMIGASLIALSLSIVLATSHFSSAADYFTVLGLVFLGGDSTIITFLIQQSLLSQAKQKSSHSTGIVQP